MQQFSNGFLRLFEQVRNNPKSEFLAQFERPSQFLALSVFSRFVLRFQGFGIASRDHGSPLIYFTVGF